jgi:two-component system, sensor histidine kinase
VLGMVDLVLDTDLDNTQKSYIRTIQQSGQVLTTVINDILEFSKLEAGSLELDKKRFDLPKLIGHIASVFQVNANDKIQMEILIKPGTPTYLLGDDIRLHQIIGNLLSNAFKFTEKGLITLTVEPHENQPDFLCFSIKDTGIGISEENQQDLFQPFKQADQSTSRRYGGTGLGLVICRRLVELMGGEITINSELGKGTEFQFTARLTKTAAPSQSATSHHTEPKKNPVYDHLNVLLVEDNSTNQLVAKTMLGKLNIPFMIANNGVEAVELVCNSNNKFDVILMDCEMPIMDGYEATRQIRAWESANAQPPTHICALTAHVLQEHVTLSKQAGMNNHITKPIRFKDLAAFFETLAD